MLTVKKMQNGTNYTAMKTRDGNEVSCTANHRTYVVVNEKEEIVYEKNPMGTLIAMAYGDRKSAEWTAAHVKESEVELI